MSAPLCAWCGDPLPVGEVDAVEDGGLCEACEEHIRCGDHCGWNRQQEVQTDES